MRSLRSEKSVYTAAMVFAALALGVLGCQSIPAKEAAAPVCRPHLYVIGDSTVADYPVERYPLTGWGQKLPELFCGARIAVVNAARSGRSSRSFYEEGSWEPIRNQLRRGDYVFIQFGHNDSKKADPARHTEPGASYQDYLHRYVGAARARGAVPVLVTPVCRNVWESNGRLKDTHGDYPGAMRDLALRENVPLLDLHAMTQARFQTLGPEKASRLFMNCNPGEFPAYPDGRADNTHLCERGAREICRMIAAWIVKSGLGLEMYLKPVAPG